MAIDLGRYSRIPTLPTVAVEVLRIFNDPNSSLDAITTVVRKDPALVGKLLKAANSSKYGARGQITDLNRAVMMMGRNSVTPLVLSFSLAQQSVDKSAHAQTYRDLWFRSFVQATAAEVLGSQFQDTVFRGECYTTNLLAGLGQLALLRAEPDRYLECLERSRREGSSLGRIEQSVLGFTNLELSVALLKQLGLPDRCLESIRLMQASSVASVSAECEGPAPKSPLAAISRTANAVASLICDGTPGVSMIALNDALAALTLAEPLQADALIGQVQQRVETTATLFDINPPKMPSPSEILQEALDQLSRFSSASESPESENAVPGELLEENGRLHRRVADLLKQSRTDVLTGIYNRAYLLTQLAERVALHRVRQQSLGLAVIDIDHFKKINDTYGHQAGDDVLRCVAECVQGCLRDSDLLARYGGEEFVVLMDDANGPGLSVVAERLRATIESLVVTFEGKQIPVTISIGLTQSHVVGEETAFARQLFAIADAAMYRAKQGGRNRFCVEHFSHEQPSSSTVSPPVSALGAVSRRPENAGVH